MGERNIASSAQQGSCVRFMQQAHVFLLQLASILLLIACSLGLMACSGIDGMPIPGFSSGKSVSEWANRVQQANADMRGERLQHALQEAANQAQTFAALEREIEKLCTAPTDNEYASKLYDLQATHKQLITDEEEHEVLATSLSTIQEGISWLETLAQSESQQAQEAQELLAQLQRAQAGVESMQTLLAYEKNFLQAKAKLGAAPENPFVGDVNEYYEDTWAAKADYEALEAPASMAPFKWRYVNIWNTMGTFFYDSIERNNTSPLDVRNLDEMVDWAVLREAACLRQQSNVAARTYEYAAELFANKDTVAEGMNIDYSCIDEIAPNLYSTLHSVLDISICTFETQDIILEVEVAGFSLAHTAKYSLQPGLNFIACKPEMLTTLTTKDLERGRTTQINFKITDTSGTVLEQQSSNVEILSVFDFNWEDDEFGLTAQFDVLAWLSAGSKAVDEVNRKATEYMGEWTDGEYPELFGYQYEENWYATLLQVAAIQRAISELGVAYVNDNYSSRADQHILTPERVLERKQALCIESSLLMASCLLSAGMHPFIVIQPGHSQIAVETWANSGHYYLVETTRLPYSGINVEADLADPAAYEDLFPSYESAAGYISWVADAPEGSWNAYFDMVSDGSDEYGGVFVIDCYLQRIMGINGLES